MSLTLILAAMLAAPASASAPSPVRPVDRSQSDQTRLNELQIDVRTAVAKGEIDQATARQFHFGIERLRRQLIVMGIQVGYRQKVRMRAKIDALEARLAQKRMRKAL